MAYKHHHRDPEHPASSLPAWWVESPYSMGGGHHPAAAYDTIADRDADAANLQPDDMVAVRDASGDPTVGAGAAIYIWDGSAFIKVSESESTDVVHLWSSIQGGPVSSPGAIDAAVAVSHQHGQPLADIDQAAQWRHQHPNKPVLDKIGEGGVNDAHITYDGNPFVMAAKGAVYLYVSPNAQSQHTGDVPSVGWAGIEEALRLAPLYASAPGTAVFIMLRDGVYDGRGARPLEIPAGVAITVRPVSSPPRLPEPSAYSYADHTHDQDTLRSAYKVRIEFDSWTCFYVASGNGVRVQNVLIENVSTVHRRIFYVCNASFLITDRVSSINAYAAYEALDGSFARANYGGHHLLHDSTGYLVRAYNGATVGIYGGKGSDRVISAYGSHVFYASEASNVVAGGSDSDHPIIVRNMKYDLFNGNFGSFGYFYRIDVDAGRYGFYGVYGVRVRAQEIKFRHNSSPVAYGYAGAQFYIYKFDVDSGAPEATRRVWMRVNSSCYTAGGHAGALSYNPAIGVTGNRSSNIAGTA